MAGAPRQDMQLRDELPLLFPCLLPPRFPAELLPLSASRWGGRPATPWLLGLAHCCWALHLRDEGSKQAVPAGISSPR